MKITKVENLHGLTPVLKGLYALKAVSVSVEPQDLMQIIVLSTAMKRTINAKVMIRKTRRNFELRLSREKERFGVFMNGI